MKAGRTIRDTDSMRAFAVLTITLAKGEAAAKMNAACSATKPHQNHQKPSNNNHAIVLPESVLPESLTKPHVLIRKARMLLSQKSQLSKKSRPFFIAGIVSTALLTGCMTTDPNTGERKVSHTTKDAGIGAVAGAILGAATSSNRDRTRGVLTGAAVGGGIGAAVGHHTDKQEAELRKKLENSGVEVQRQGNTINLVVPSAISFATNSAQLTPNFYESLNKVATSLKDYSDSTVQIVGHTDSTGAAAYNQQLSVNRANAVVVYLAAQGVASERMQAVGMGASQPIADNKTVEGRAQNRRVEIKIIPRETAPANG
jgi:outer membrane protein OmpA-like peptidoglycan-associated protein